MPYSLDLIRDIARRHGLHDEPVLLPEGGMVNDAYLIGEAVLRIVREGNDEECDPEAAREAALVPLAIAAGVRTPELIAADPIAAHAPRPYTIYRRAHGSLMGFEKGHPTEYGRAYRTLGQEIYKISTINVPEELAGMLRIDEPPNPRESLKRTVDKGAITVDDAREIEAWLDQLEPRVVPPSEHVFIHNDLHPWNLMVDPESRELSWILDWGDAGSGDLAKEFCSMPFAALPEMIAGFKEAGGTWTDDLTLRCTLYGLVLALWEVRSLEERKFERNWWRMPVDGWRAIIS